MRRLSNIILAVFIAIAAVGCDTEDDPTHFELFVGTWNLVSIADANGDQTQGFASVANSLTATFMADDQFRIVVNYREESGRNDLELPGTFTVDEGQRKLVLQVTNGPQVGFDYEFANDDQIALSAPADLVNPLFNPTTPYEGTVHVVVRRSMA